MQYSATSGWHVLVARRQAEILRFHVRNRNSFGLLSAFKRWIFRLPAHLPPDSLECNPPVDPWKDTAVADRIEAMMGGQGLDAGPLKLAGESLFRKMGRDPQLKRVMQPYELGGGTILDADTQDAGGLGLRNNLTMIQID